MGSLRRSQVGAVSVESAITREVRFMLNSYLFHLSITIKTSP